MRRGQSDTSDTMLRSIRFWIAVVLAGILAVCMIMKEHRDPQKDISHSQKPETAPDRIQETSETVTAARTMDLPAATAAVTTEHVLSSETEEPEPDASVPEISDRKIKEITGKLKEVSRYSDDLIGWIYIADSDIDYPVVQGTDNQYYLHHAPDGSENILGTIFLSYQCAPDFSDNLNILYGHNMQSGMFGDIRRFKEQDEFASHRYGWLLTKEVLFRIDFYALAVISAYDELYDIPADSAAWQEALRARSMHYTETEPAADLPVLALSTCAVDFGDARALFTGRLVRIRGISPADTA